MHLCIPQNVGSDGKFEISHQIQILVLGACLPSPTLTAVGGRDSRRERGREGEGGTKAILRKTDVARPKGSTRHCWGLFYAFYSSSLKFLPQMILFILQILAPSYQNSQLAPSEGHFLVTAPVACVASSSSRRH